MSMRELEDRLLRDAMALSELMRDDLAAAHRMVRYSQRLKLEQLCCVLAAMVDPGLPIDPWWAELPEVRWP
jgi:hypothetical protein